MILDVKFLASFWDTVVYFLVARKLIPTVTVNCNVVRECKAVACVPFVYKHR